MQLCSKLLKAHRTNTLLVDNLKRYTTQTQINDFTALNQIIKTPNLLYTNPTITLLIHGTRGVLVTSDLTDKFGT